MSANSILYKRLIDTTEEFLGPAAQRFIDRQIQSHLNKEPGNINQKDLEKLIEWSSIAISLLTDDKKIIHDYTFSLRRLSRGNH